MSMRLPIRGRGASHHPPNRFDALHVERDAWVDADDPAPRTRFYRDATRDPISTNDSPDVPLDIGINPYRGCEHGCVYCLGPDTPVLHADLTWRPVGEVEAGDELVGFDEYPEPRRTRKLRRAVVEAVWWSRKPTLRLVTERTRVVTTTEHRWLQARDFRWSTTRALVPGRTLRHLDVSTERKDEDYRLGYVSGLSLGDGTMRYTPGQRSDRLGYPTPYWRVALKDREPLERVVRYLRGWHIDVAIRDFDPGPSTKGTLHKVETRSLGKLDVIHQLLRIERPTPSYRRGFIAGFFDAEGYHGDTLRISQVDLRVLGRVQRYGASLGFRFVLESYEGRAASTVRLVGSLRDRMRFLSVCGPCIPRKLGAIFGRTPSTEPDPIVAIERGPVGDVVDIQTSTGTFYAAGLATHNCFARPYHEYLGFDAGLDFETKIVVKEDAPRLLRERLASPKWEPRPLMMSGATDPYQPAERRLGVTRGVLEVLAEFRQPVAVITKNHLVTRDVDLLAELARHDAAAVVLSVTTLRNELQRVMEPRTSIPARRLAAIEKLAAAGVPVGVNVAPVIPGLTDHELPEILRAAADAGATTAGYILLRLPHGVADLFTLWLEQHFPDRKEKVLGRLREIASGGTGSRCASGGGSPGPAGGRVGGGGGPTTGRLYNPEWGARKKGSGPWAEQIRDLFHVTARSLGLEREGRGLSAAAFRRPHGPGGQTDLFG